MAGKARVNGRTRVCKVLASFSLKALSQQAHRHRLTLRRHGHLLRRHARP